MSGVFCHRGGASLCRGSGGPFLVRGHEARCAMRVQGLAHNLHWVRLTEPARETAIGWSRTVGGEKTRIYEDSVSRPLDVATPAATSTVRCTSTVSERREAFRVREGASVLCGDPVDGEAGATPRSKEFVDEVLRQVPLRGELVV